MGYLVTHRKRTRMVRVRRGFGDALIAATASSNPNSTTPSDGDCSPDGQFVWRVLPGSSVVGRGTWVRRDANAPACTRTSGVGAVITTHNADGSTDTVYPDGSTSHTNPVVTPTSMICAAPPTTGIAVTVPQFPGVTLIVDGTENTPITYQLRCVDSGPLGLTRDQLGMVIWLIQHPMRRVGDQVDFNTLIYGMPGQAPVDMVTGQEALISFTGPDGDTKNLFLKIGGDPKTPTFTFVWSHQPTLFQAIDNFITSISPFDPAPLLCQMLPMTTKVPNPYVQAGSIVLQLSGKCPPSCPPGMQYDATAKTCSCPPGLVPNPNTLKCEPPGSGLKKWIVPALAIGAGALLIAALNKKARATP